MPQCDQWLVALETGTLGVDIRFPLRCVISSDLDVVQEMGPIDPAIRPLIS
jgi:hypothetical protein